MGEDPRALARDVLDKLYTELAKFPGVATTNDHYMALAYAVRDREILGPAAAVAGARWRIGRVGAPSVTQARRDAAGDDGAGDAIEKVPPRDFPTHSAPTGVGPGCACRVMARSGERRLRA